MHDGVPNKEFNENNNQCILDQLKSNRAPLDNSDNIKYINSLLEVGANLNIQNQDEETLSYYLDLDKELFNILNELAIDRSLLGNYVQYIMFLLKAGADPNVQNQDGKTLSYYLDLDKKLFNILNELAIDRSLLDNYVQYIMFLLKAGADPNVQNQDGKTLLHYVAERNGTDVIGFLLKAGADPNVQDHSGRTPLDYATNNNCRQVLKDLGDKTTCTKLSDPDPESDYYSDDSCENEENLAKSPDNGNRTFTDQQTSSERPVVSDRNSEDEGSSCSLRNYLFLKDSLLAKLEIPLTTDEQKLIGKFCEKIRGITAHNKQESEESILESIEKIVNEYLTEGMRLNSSCSNGNEEGDKETVTNLILEEIEGVLSDRVKPRDGTKEYIGRVNDITDQDDDNEGKVSGIIENITNELLLKGGKARQKFFLDNTELAQDYGFNYIDNLSKECKEIENKLISIACEGIVGRDGQAKKGKLEAVEIDNQYFYMKYSQDSIIEPVKIFNKAEASKDKALNLKVGILQIGKSIVGVEGTKDGKRNYTDILEGSIEMSFTTEVGEISIYLSPSKKDGNKIEVEIDDESEARLNKLKAEKKSLGGNCLLGGKSVLEAIEDKGFKKNGNVPTESIKITKDVPFTDFTQAYSRQIDISGKGRQ